MTRTRIAIAGAGYIGQAHMAVARASASVMLSAIVDPAPAAADIAAQAGVAGHLEITDQSVLAAQSGLFKSIHKPGVYMGNPARPIREEQRKLAALSRLPELRKEFGTLKKKLEEPIGE